MSIAVTATVRNGSFLLTTEVDNVQKFHVFDGSLTSQGVFGNYGEALKKTKLIAKLEEVKQVTKEADELSQEAVPVE